MKNLTKALAAVGLGVTLAVTFAPVDAGSSDEASARLTKYEKDSARLTGTTDGDVLASARLTSARLT